MSSRPARWIAVAAVRSSDVCCDRPGVYLVTRLQSQTTPLRSRGRAFGITSLAMLHHGRHGPQKRGGPATRRPGSRSTLQRQGSRRRHWRRQVGLDLGQRLRCADDRRCRRSRARPWRSRPIDWSTSRPRTISRAWRRRVPDWRSGSVRKLLVDHLDSVERVHVELGLERRPSACVDASNISTSRRRSSVSASPDRWLRQRKLVRRGSRCARPRSVGRRPRGRRRSRGCRGATPTSAPRRG